MFSKKPTARRTQPTTAKPAMNYYRSKAPGQPPIRQPRHFGSAFKFLVKRLGDVFTLLAVLALVVYSLILRPSPKISTNSEIYHTTDTYRQAIASQLKSIKNRNKVTFDESGLLKTLQSVFPEVSSASVHLPLFSQTPRLALYISPPIFKLVNGNSAYIVNTDGLVVGPASAFPKIKNLPAIQDQSGFLPTLGRPAFSSSGVVFVNQLIAQVQKAKVPIKSIVLPARAQELDFTASDHSYYVKFYLGGDPLMQVGQYLAVRYQFDKNHSQPRHYLDVRVAGKVFYK